jgi:hypothetical protein
MRTRSYCLRASLSRLSPLFADSCFRSSFGLSTFPLLFPGSRFSCVVVLFCFLCCVSAVFSVYFFLARRTEKLSRRDGGTEQERNPLRVRKKRRQQERCKPLDLPCCSMSVWLLHRHRGGRGFASRLFSEMVAGVGSL